MQGRHFFSSALEGILSLFHLRDVQLRNENLPPGIFVALRDGYAHPNKQGLPGERNRLHFVFIECLALRERNQFSPKDFKGFFCKDAIQAA